MRKLTATLCLTLAVLLGSEVRGSDLPICRGILWGDWDNCSGTLTFADGDQYVGEWRDGIQHGQGTYTFADGSKYVGEWRDDQFHGQGTYTFADGRVMEGIWKNNEFQYAQKVSPTVTVRKSPPSSKSAAEKEVENLLTENEMMEIIEQAKRETEVDQKVSPTVTARRSPPPSRNAAEKEVETLRKEIARLKKENQSRPKQVAKKPSPKKSPPPKSGTTGSGFFVSKLGHILTNEHVIRECGSVTVGDNANKQVAASVLETDKRNDLALLRISSTQMASVETKSLISKLGLKLVPLASEGLFKSDDVELGEDVLVAGYPYGELFSNSIKVTKGIVSSNKGMGDDSGQFQMDAAVQPGNSGGPIYDENGNIVGVVISQLDKRKVEKVIGSLPENVNFGIKASTVRQFLTSAGLPTKWSNRTERKSTKELAQIAKNQTVMVVCNP